MQHEARQHNHGNTSASRAHDRRNQSNQTGHKTGATRPGHKRGATRPGTRQAQPDRAHDRRNRVQASATQVQPGHNKGTTRRRRVLSPPQCTGGITTAPQRLGAGGCPPTSGRRQMKSERTSCGTDRTSNRRMCPRSPATPGTPQDESVAKYIEVCRSNSCQISWSIDDLQQ